MRDNLYNDDDPALITKKFWSHVKSKNVSHRIPDCIHRNATFRHKPLDKAELFNDVSIKNLKPMHKYFIRQIYVIV